MPSNGKAHPKKKSNGAQRANGKKQNKQRKSAIAERRTGNPFDLQGNLRVAESAPSAYAQGVRNTGPRIRATEKFVRITHEEPIGFLSQLGDPFNIQMFLAINPGLSTTFRWLSTQAVGWEKYMFKSLRFYYRTRVPTSNGGSVLMAIDHDAADGPPNNEETMMNYAGAVEDSIWCKNIIVSARCDNVKRYNRFAALATNLDVKTYDLGNFIAASSGMGLAGKCGKLWASYTVDMFIPQLPNNFNPNVGGTVNSGGAISAPNPFGTAPTLSVGTTGIVMDTNSRLNFPNIGQYLIAATATGTGLTALPGPTMYSGAGTVTDVLSVPNAAATTSLLKSVINITSPDSKIDFNWGGALTTLTGSHLDVANAPGGLV
jgi:hypothetical protein